MKQSKDEKLRQGIRRNIKRLTDARRKDKERRYEKFNKIKERHMSFKMDADINRYVWLDEDLFLERPLRMIYIYPILCMMVDSRVKPYACNVSVKNLAKLSGVGLDTVQRILKELERFEYIAIEKISNRSVHYNRYTLSDYIDTEIAKEDYSCYRRFKTYLVESGVWSELSNRAKKVYWVLRAIAKPNFEIWCDMEEIDDCGKNNAQQYFGNRNWDLAMDVNYYEIADRAGISRDDVRAALRELERRELIWWLQDNDIAVHFIPHNVYRNAYPMKLVDVMIDLCQY